MTSIKDLRALLAAATPGPYACELDIMDPVSCELVVTISPRRTESLFIAETEIKNVGTDGGAASRRARETQDYRDGQLLAAAVNALPELLDRLETAEARLRELEVELEATGAQVLELE